MKITKETKHKFSFDMADKKTSYGPHPIIAETEEAAKVIFTGHLFEMIFQMGIETFPKLDRELFHKKAEDVLDLIEKANNKEEKEAPKPAEKKEA